MTFEKVATLAREASKLLDAQEEAAIDKKIASRSGVEEKIIRADEAYSASLSAWSDKWREGRQALRELCEQHGLSPNQLRQLL